MGYEYLKFILFQKVELILRLAYFLEPFAS